MTYAARRPLGRALLAVLLGAAPVAAQEPAGVTLREAMRLSARVNPDVIQAEGNFRGAGAGTRTAYGSFLPRITGSASGGSNFSEGPPRPDPITGEIISGNTQNKSASFGLSGTLDLFAGFRRTAELRAAKERESQTAAALNEAQSQSGLATAQDFFAALSARELLRVRDESVRRATEQLAIASARLATRAGSVQDSLRAVVQLGQARLALVNQQAALARAEASLARRVGVQGRVQAVADSSVAVPGTPIDTAVLMREALAQAPSVLRAEAGVKAADASLSAARSAYWPSLSLSGRYDFSGGENNNYTFYNARNLTLGMSWPLFNGFQREQTVVERAASRDAERARAADARRLVAANLTAQFAQLAAAQQRLDLTRISVEAARAEVAIALERYRLGSITITELNASQSGLDQAEEDQVNARFEYLRARAEIEAIIGRPL